MPFCPIMRLLTMDNLFLCMNLTLLKVDILQKQMISLHQKFNKDFCSSIVFLEFVWLSLNVLVPHTALTLQHGCTFIFAQLTYTVLLCERLYKSSYLLLKFPFTGTLQIKYWWVIILIVSSILVPELQLLTILFYF